MITYIGIDPGKSGAMCVLHGRTSVVPVFYPFDEGVYVDVLKEIRQTHWNEGMFCVVEKVHAMPKQGVSSMFSFGMNFGFIQGTLKTIGIPYQLVEPRTWTASFGCGSDKNRHIEVAKRLFPNVSLKRTEKCRKDFDGFADALLLAEYGHRIHPNPYPINRVSIGSGNV